MDEAAFKDKVIALYNYRQEAGCPTMKCKYLQDVILKEVANNSYELCIGISALLLLYDIKLKDEILVDMVSLMSKNMVKYSVKCSNEAFEVCQACSVSKLMDKKDVQ